MHFGGGILPSSTISSNFVTATPTYAAAAGRFSPRGGRFGGNESWRAHCLLLAFVSDQKKGSAKLNRGARLKLNESLERSRSYLVQIDGEEHGGWRGSISVRRVDPDAPWIILALNFSAEDNRLEALESFYQCRGRTIPTRERPACQWSHEVSCKVICLADAEAKIDELSHRRQYQQIGEVELPPALLVAAEK